MVISYIETLTNLDSLRPYFKEEGGEGKGRGRQKKREEGEGRGGKEERGGEGIREIYTEREERERDRDRERKRERERERGEKLFSHSTSLLEDKIQDQRIYSSLFSQALPLSLVAALLQALPALSQGSLRCFCIFFSNEETGHWMRSPSSL